MTGGATVCPDALELHTDLYISSVEGAFTWEWMQQMLEVPHLLELDPGLVEDIELRGGAGKWRKAAAEEQADILQRLNGFCPRTSYERAPAEGALELVIRRTDSSAPLRLFLESSALVWNGVRYESYTGNCFPKVWRNELLGVQEAPFREDAVRKGEALFHFDRNDVESVVLNITDDHDGGGIWRMPEDAAQIGEAVKRLNAFRYTSTAKRTGLIEEGTYGIQLTGKHWRGLHHFSGHDLLRGRQPALFYGGMAGRLRLRRFEGAGLSILKLAGKRPRRPVLSARMERAAFLRPFSRILFPLQRGGYHVQ